MFQGYTQETVDFMWGIRFNNERGWFLEHKQQYQTQLLEPTRALGEQVYEGVQAMLPREQMAIFPCKASPRAAKSFAVP